MTGNGQVEIRASMSPLPRLKALLWKIYLLNLREAWLSYIPGTRQFQHRYLKQIARETIKRVKLFKDLHALDSTTKRYLFSGVRTYENRWAVMVVGRRYVAIVSLLVFLIVMAVAIVYLLLLTTAQVYLAMPPLIKQIGWGSFTIYGLIIVIVGVGLIVVSIVVIPALIQWYPSFILSLLSIICMLLLGLAFYHDISSGKSLWDIVNFMFTINQPIFFVMFVSLLIFLLWFVLIKIIFERQLRVFYPDAVLVHTLLSVLSIVEKQPRRWAELGFRRQLIPMLEQAAICIQHGLRRQCQSGDDTVDIWAQDITARQAAALRELKKWVLIPKSDTRNQFIARIAAGLSQITSGNWDALEQREPEKISRLQWWRSHAVATLRALYQGGLPVLGLWAFQQTSLAFKGEYATYATAVVFLWAMWVLITTYDPFLAMKITTFKEVVQSVPRLGSLLGKDKK